MEPAHTPMEDKTAALREAIRRSVVVSATAFDPNVARYAGAVADAIVADLGMEVVGWFSFWPGTRRQKFNTPWELGPKAAAGIAIKIPLDTVTQIG